MSPRARYTQRAPKIIRILSFKGSRRGSPGGDHPINSVPEGTSIGSPTKAWWSVGSIKFESLPHGAPFRKVCLTPI